MGCHGNFGNFTPGSYTESINSHNTCCGRQDAEVTVQVGLGSTGIHGSLNQLGRRHGIKIDVVAVETLRGSCPLRSGSYFTPLWRCEWPPETDKLMCGYLRRRKGSFKGVYLLPLQPQNDSFD